MNMYVNLCPAYTQKSDSVTMDVPSDMTEHFMQMVYTLSDEKNISARRAMNDMLRYTFDTLMEKDYERKSRKNAQRRGRNR
jgi:outer membrane receptor for Fe3+-dicitrate